MLILLNFIFRSDNSMPGSSDNNPREQRPGGIIDCQKTLLKLQLLVDNMDSSEAADKTEITENVIKIMVDIGSALVISK